MKIAQRAWEAHDQNSVSVTFYVGGSRGYSDYQVIHFPLDWVDNPAWREQLAQTALNRQMQQALIQEEAARALEQNEREQLAKLKEKYPDA